MVAVSFWARRVCIVAFAAMLAPVAAAQLFADDEARARLDKHQKQLEQFAGHILELRKQGAALTQRLQKAETGLRELRGAQQEQSESSRREQANKIADTNNRVIAAEEQLAELRELLDAIRSDSAVINNNVAELYALIQLPLEQDLYDAAFAEFQASRYQSALDGFRRVQRFYPNGKFYVNAGYWISNALLALEDYEAVITAADDLITRHADSDKTPDAMLLMARALLQLGREEEAKEVLRRIVAEHSTSLAADKARQQL